MAGLIKKKKKNHCSYFFTNTHFLHKLRLTLFYFCSQVLVTKPDFYNEETRRNLFSTLSELISLNIVPIINTNDAVTPPPQRDDEQSGKVSGAVNFFTKLSITITDTEYSELYLNTIVMKVLFYIFLLIFHFLSIFLKSK